LREQPRQQQAIAFAAGQTGHFGTRTLWRKQKITEIGNHVLADTRNLDEIQTGEITSMSVACSSSCTRNWSK